MSSNPSTVPLFDEADEACQALPPPSTMVTPTTNTTSSKTTGGMNTEGIYIFVS
jgi:hypothetical protein